VSFSLSGEGMALTTYEVLVEAVPDGGAAGRVFRLLLASFPERAAGEKLLAAVEKDSGLRGRVIREAVSGRFAVRVGSWDSEFSAASASEGLSRLGYEGVRVVGESAAPARYLALRPSGAPASSTSAPVLVALAGSASAWIEVDGVPYRGFLEIRRAASGGVTVINVVHLEDYLKGVVPAELSPEAYPQLEALKAQAIAARTYVLKRRGQFGSDGFDICATPACQVYRGLAVEHRLSSEAVAATAGEVLTYNGELAEALYTSTCGGRTEDAENVFSGPGQPYLVSQRCYAEQPPLVISATAPPLSPEAGGALLLGLTTDQELSAELLDSPATLSQFSIWGRRALAVLGQKPCATSPSSGALNLGRFAELLAQMLCWDTRLAFLLSPEDVDQLVPASAGLALSEPGRRALAYWLQEQVVRPDPRGLSYNRPVSRLDLAESLYRLVARRGEPPLSSAVLLGVEEGMLRLKAGEVEHYLPLAPRRYLFRRTGAFSYFAPTLPLAPGDRVAFHRGAEGVDFLELQSAAASFDRSSSFSQWVVRKTQSQLTSEVNGREPQVGTVLELQPRRYGRSGRVAELEIIGSGRSLTLRGLSIRTRLGLRENLFFIDRQADGSGSTVAWVFSGRGWGHGVGLCQVGAYGMAAAGRTYREILAHYYPKTEVQPARLAGSTSGVPPR